jgi:ATP-dependent Clp protease ATP-binding subunit ClpA
MFERFTDRARRVVVLAREEAQLLNHNYIGTEHILLGLISERDGIAARTLERLGISLEAVRARVEAVVERGEDAPTGHIPFTPRAKTVLELSLRESLKLGHNYIGTEHILLGLLREAKGVGATVLMNLGADLSAVRKEVLQLLSGYRGGQQARMHPVTGIRYRETPAAAKAGVEARRLAGSGAIGTSHYLLALLQEQESMAAQALAALGVTREDIEAKLAELDPTGTSDEAPEEAGGRGMGLTVEGRMIKLDIDDAHLAASLKEAMSRNNVSAVKGTDPEAVAAGFPNLWSAVARTVEDLTRRLTRASAAHEPLRGPTAYWRPPALRDRARAASYWVANGPDGPDCHLEIGPATDREKVRAWLAAWFRDRRSSLPGAAGAENQLGAAALWLGLDAAGEGFTVRGFGFGPAALPGAVSVPLEDLVDAAIEDLELRT